MKDLRKFIATTIREFLNENKTYKLPQYLYHLTSLEKFENIRKDGGIFLLKFSTEMLIRMMNGTLTHNVLQIAEGGDYEALTFKITQMLNRSTAVHFSTTPPLLAICCYVPFFFTNLKKYV